MSTFDESRHPRGRAGKFAAKTKPGAGVSLGPPGQAASQGSLCEQTMTATRADVRPDELNDMLDPGQPVPVRAAAARCPYPGVAERAANDPSPYVRALASAGWDLSEQARSQLARDRQVQGLLAALSGDGVHPSTAGAG